MANQVYANGREVSCKAADGKSICAFPDVCLSPPSPPAGPVPIPYPNTGMASDTTDGAKSVQISGKEVMLKNKSYFKKSTGDEAATKTLGMGVITHQITGKVYFTSWSMNVKAESENVVRHFDTTTHNHMSVPGNESCPWPYIDAAAVPSDHPCKGDADKEAKACKDYKPNKKNGPDACAQAGAKSKPKGSKSSPQASNMAARTQANECLAARRCRLQPYDSGKTKCCKGQTPHHIVEASAFFDSGRGGKGSNPLKGITKYDKKKKNSATAYKEGDAPCVCVEGKNQNTGTHNLMHVFQSHAASKCKSGKIALANGKSITDKKTNYKTAKDNGIKALNKTFPGSSCNKKCLAAQMDAYHNQAGIKDNTPIKAVETGKPKGSTWDQAKKGAEATLKNLKEAIKKAMSSGGAGAR